MILRSGDLNGLSSTFTVFCCSHWQANLALWKRPIRPSGLMSANFPPIFSKNVLHSSFHPFWPSFLWLCNSHLQNISAPPPCFTVGKVSLSSKAWLTPLQMEHLWLWPKSSFWSHQPKWLFQKCWGWSLCCLAYCEPDALGHLHCKGFLLATRPFSSLFLKCLPTVHQETATQLSSYRFSAEVMFLVFFFILNNFPGSCGRNVFWSTWLV